MPDLFDVIELTVDIPARGLRAGTQGTIVERHPGDAYEVEVSNEAGETVDLVALRADQFIVVWQTRTRTWLPVSERVAALVAELPAEAQHEVLDFARFLRVRKPRSAAESPAHSEMVTPAPSP